MTTSSDSVCDLTAWGLVRGLVGCKLLCVVVLCMQEHLPPEQLAAVKRVLYGANQGQPVGALELPKQAQQAAAEQSFDLQGYAFKAASEQLRAPRVVRIGLIQHGIVKPTTTPFLEQRQVRLSLDCCAASTVSRCGRFSAEVHVKCKSSSSYLISNPDSSSVIGAACSQWSEIAGLCS